MRRLIIFSLLVSFLIFNFVNAEISPALVRIRMAKEIDSFPIVKGASTKKITENLWSLRGENIKYAEKFFPRDNFIIKKENGKFDIIAVVDFNEYLASVVAHEMPPDWPIEALKSQAVVARSYALARIAERRNSSFHLESDQGDQVYSAWATEKTRRAVAATEGVLIRTPAGKVVKAFYHSDCGGETVSAANVWGAQAFDSGTAKDPWCAQKKSNQWNFEIAKTEFFNKLELKDTDQFQISRYADKTQVISIGEKFFSVQKLREIFGFFKIRSSIDSLEMNSESVKINGQGFGHGAGLCQWGTLAQAKEGKGYLQILKHYYPRANVARDSYKLSLNLPLNLPQKTVSN